MCLHLFHHRKYRLHYYANLFQRSVATLSPYERLSVYLQDVTRIVLGWSHPVFDVLPHKPPLDRCFTLYQYNQAYPMKLRDDAKVTVADCVRYIHKVNSKVLVVTYDKYVPAQNEKQQRLLLLL